MARVGDSRRWRRGDGRASDLKLMVALHKHDRCDVPAERGRKLRDQWEMQLEGTEAAITEDEVAAARVRPPLPAHLPRERVVRPSPTTARAAAAS